MGFVMILTILQPEKFGKAEVTNENIWHVRFSRLPKLLPFLILMAAILGSMYTGLASPTEVAVVATVCIMAFEGSLSLSALNAAAIGTSRTVSMLGLIIAAASFLSVAMGFLGMPQAIERYITSLDLEPLMLILLLMVIYVILGSFLEGMSIIVITIPIALPLVMNAGFDQDGQCIGGT
jgi:TRAP-type C4-dicarboxylate transport system permease large subunit